ncbi:MAG: transposase [Treponema sp.]|nr:transposase [Treponema sp.]
MLNAIRLKTADALSESKNNSIQQYKKTAFGYRNKERFR